MAKIKVVLTFLYHTDEDISEWNTDVDFDKVETKEQAVDMAIAELEANSPHDFQFDVYDEDGELM